MAIFSLLESVVESLEWVDRDAKIVLKNFVLNASGLNPSKNFMIINYHACEIPEKKYMKKNMEKKTARQDVKLQLMDGLL